MKLRVATPLPSVVRVSVSSPIVVFTWVFAKGFPSVPSTAKVNVDGCPTWPTSGVPVIVTRAGWGFGTSTARTLGNPLLLSTVHRVRAVTS